MGLGKATCVVFSMRPPFRPVSRISGRHGAIFWSLWGLTIAHAPAQAHVDKNNVFEAHIGTRSLSPAQKGWVARAEDSLNAISMLRARFVQTASDGSRLAGTVWIKRPGNMRFDYDPPSPLLMVASQGQFVYQDKELGQVTALPIEKTPLGLLLKPRLRLEGDVNVTQFSLSEGMLALTLVRTTMPDEGSLTLIFAGPSLVLKAWSVVDAQGLITRIDLTDITVPRTLSDKLFALPKVQE